MKMSVELGKNHFSASDYIVVLATLLFSTSIGVYYAFKDRKSANSEELLSGSRQMGAIPVAASMLVSYLSAITILGVPAEVYAYGSQIFLGTLLSPVALSISIYTFVGVMYDLKLTSAYKYLEGRYSSTGVRWVTSMIFILELVLINGIVMYAPAIALETMMGVPVWITVFGVAVCGTLYTSMGGIKAVVWTDAFQFIMIFAGMVAIVMKGLSKVGGLSNAFNIAHKFGRTDILNWTVDPFMRHNTINLFLGHLITGLYFVVHQPVVQRYCSLPTYQDAVKSLLWTVIFGYGTIGLVVLTGISIFAAYAKCDPITTGQIHKQDQIVPFFVNTELRNIPGLMGLFVAVVFSAVLSTISSTLNSLAAVTWEDFLVKIPMFKNMNDFGQSLTYKILTILYSVVIVSLAFYVEHMGSILQACATVVTIAVSVQGSVFLMGVFMPCVNKIGAIGSMIIGIIVMGYISLQAFFLQQKYDFQPKLNFSTEGCSDKAWASVESLNLTKADILLPASDLEYPTKYFTVSYCLYPVLGLVITITTGVLLSLMTGGRGQAQHIKPEYLHPLVRPLPLYDEDDECDNADENDYKEEKFEMTATT